MNSVRVSRTWWTYISSWTHRNRSHSSDIGIEDTVKWHHYQQTACQTSTQLTNLTSNCYKASSFHVTLRRGDTTGMSTSLSPHIVYASLNAVSLWGCIGMVLMALLPGNPICPCMVKRHECWTELWWGIEQYGISLHVIEKYYKLLHAKLNSSFLLNWYIYLYPANVNLPSFMVTYQCRCYLLV